MDRDPQRGELTNDWGASRGRQTRGGARRYFGVGPVRWAVRENEGGAGSERGGGGRSGVRKRKANREEESAVVEAKGSECGGMCRQTSEKTRVVQHVTSTNENGQRQADRRGMLTLGRKEVQRREPARGRQTRRSKESDGRGQCGGLDRLAASGDTTVCCVN